MFILFELFITFAKIGMFTFGGGYAMISLIENICVENKKWITHDEMMTITVIAESTPGPIAINCATYVGYKRGKLSGAIAATIGMVVPSLKGIKIAVGILIVDAAIKMIQKMKKTALQIGMVSLAVISMILIKYFAFNISSMVLLMVFAIIGLSVFAIENRIYGEDTKE